MIGIIGIMGFVGAIIAAVTAAVTAAVSIGCAADASIKQKEAQNKAEDGQKKQLAMEKSMRKKESLRSRRAAAAGTLASIIEAKRNKYKTDATYRKLANVESTQSILGKARVNRSTYHYGTPAGS